MNPLKLRLPIPAQVDIAQRAPRPAEIRDWLASLPAHDPAANLVQVAALLVRYNQHTLPTSQRFEALQILQPWVMRQLPARQQKYRDQSLPLTRRRQGLADEVFDLLDNLAQGYKQVISDAISDADADDLTPDTFLLALRQTIEQTGLLMLEAYAQYRSEPVGLWGELHRLYALAERNGLNTMAIEGNDADGQPLTTIQHAYLRIVLLGLAQPYRLQSGQADILYGLLRQWTIGCRLVEKKGTLAEAGDCVVDLAGSQPPKMATQQTRFRPVDGRFLDISTLRQRLEEMSRQKADTSNQPLAERLRRDLLMQLCKVWQGRGERQSERQADGRQTYMMCIGLGAAHHQVSNEAEFTPEQDESEFHQPQKRHHRLSLQAKDDASPQFGATTADGREATRISRFTVDADVWDAVHDTQLHARVLRESAMAGYAVEPWRCINHSDGGIALRRQPDTRARARVGVLTAYRHEHELSHWHIGTVRWLQINKQGSLELGIKSLGNHMAAVAVRAIGGAGSGGEYFRSLLIDVTDTEGHTGKGLLVPVSIYDIGTQLVLNLKIEMKYIRLTHIIETTSAFTLFAFRSIDMPPQEKARVQGLPDPG